MCVRSPSSPVAVGRMRGVTDMRHAYVSEGSYCKRNVSARSVVGRPRAVWYAVGSKWGRRPLLYKTGARHASAKPGC